MTREETWERLVNIGVVEGPMPDEQWDLTEVDLGVAKLGGANLSGADLSGANLMGADLRGANLYRANLYRANLSELSPLWTKLTVADLSEISLRGTDISGANLSEANLSEASFTGTDLSRADLGGANLSGTNLSGKNLSEKNLSGTSLIGTDLSGADLSRADLSEADLSGANLSMASLIHTRFLGANFTLADLDGVKFDGVDLRDANLRGVDISGADFSDLDLTGVNLTEARVRDTKFTGSNLTRAILSGAIMVRTDLVQANLTDADISGAILDHANTSGWIIKGIKCTHTVDKDGKETRFGPGEFERRYTEIERLHSIVLKGPISDFSFYAGKVIEHEVNQQAKTFSVVFTGNQMKSHDLTEMSWVVLAHAEMANQQTDADFKVLFESVQNTLSDYTRILTEIQEDQIRILKEIQYGSDVSTDATVTFQAGFNMGVVMAAGGIQMPVSQLKRARERLQGPLFDQLSAWAEKNRPSIEQLVARLESKAPESILKFVRGHLPHPDRPENPAPGQKPLTKAQPENHD